MLFQSKFGLYQVFARPEIPHYHDVTGVLTGTTKALIAEFGQVGDQFQFDNWLEGGRKDIGVEIRGYYFDSDEAAERLGWTDEEKDSVEAVLLEQCRKTPTWVWHVDREPPPPEKPWASYETTHHFSIPKLAAELGLVKETLAYERATTAREGVLGPLEKKLAETETESEQEVTLTAS
jgi:hypothetical protein